MSPRHTLGGWQYFVLRHSSGLASALQVLSRTLGDMSQGKHVQAHRFLETQTRIGSTIGRLIELWLLWQCKYALAGPCDVACLPISLFTYYHANDAVIRIMR